MLADRVSLLNRALQAAAHYLPAQGPIGVFVHHNTLHAFESQPFERAAMDAAELFGAEPFAKESEYRAAFASGRILERDLDAVLAGENDEDVAEGLTKRELAKLALLHVIEEPNPEAIRWQLEEGLLFGELAGAPTTPVETLAELWKRVEELLPREVPPRARSDERLRDALLRKSGQDADLFVHPTLIRLTAAFLDQGIAYWPMPNRRRGLFHASLELLGQPAPPPNAWVRRLTREARRLAERQISAAQAVLEILDDMGLPDEQWEREIRSTLLALAGWAGMVRELEERPDRMAVHVMPLRTMDFLALRMVLEREAFRFIAENHRLPHASLAELRRSLGSPSPATADPLGAKYRAFTVLARAGITAARFRAWDARTRERFVRSLADYGEHERRRLWHAAYELRHAHQVLDPLAAHLRTAALRERSAPPRFQAIFCFDERFESVRRHLEEALVDVETWGTAGFFGVAMYYQGVDDAHPQPLCPIAITPRHEVHEHVMPGETTRHAQRRAGRRFAGKLALGADVGSRTLFRGTILSAVFGTASALPLVARVLFPRAADRLGRGVGAWSLPSVDTRLDLVRPGAERTPTARWLGFSVEEMADIVERVLGEMGLTRHFAPLVLVAGHGSSSLNNPHESAHDCGACGGGRGGPNARAFAQMANDPRVRALLSARGIEIPPGSTFVGALYDTCNDSLHLFDTDLVPKALEPELKALCAALDVTRARDAHERSRRFETASPGLSVDRALRHVEARAVDLAQPRPEYGHATNAVAFIGRRARTRGLFLDRRAFLISYDPSEDADGARLARLLAAAVPVGAGINLEYYFSYVDPVRYGAGTKLPHNITSLVGVMDGYSSDLRTGLPWQMVEIHEPVRLLAIVEASPERLVAAATATPGVLRLLENSWIRLVSLDPGSNTLQLFRAGGFSPWIAEPHELEEVSSSAAWYRGHREHLGIARITGPGT